MNKKIILVFVLLLFCGCLQEGAFSEDLIHADYGPDYKLGIELFPDEHRIEGRLKAEVPNSLDKDILGIIPPDLTIDYIKDEDGNDIEYKRERDPSYNISDSILIPLENFKLLEIHFSGKPYDNVGNRNCIGKYTYWSISQIFYLNVPSDSASFSVTVPKNFKVVKLEEGRIENSDFKYVAGEEPVVRSENNKTTYFFKSNPFGFSFVCSDYVSTLDTKDGVSYRVYLSPGHENMLKPVTTLSKKLIDFYSDKYYPYSLSEFRVVEAEGIGTIHVNDEYSTCLSTFNYSTHLYEGLKDLGFEKQMSKTLERYFDSIAGVLIHEASHFWFGGLVISEKLNEAFAVFSELLFTEHLDPNLSKELRKYYTDVLIGITDWQNVSLAEVTPYTDPNYNIIYYKGE